jgi:hypothetical protein
MAHNQHGSIDGLRCPRTLIRARTAIRLWDTLFLGECVRAPLIPRSDSLHNGVRMILYREDERNRRNVRCAENAETQGRRGGRLWGGRVEHLVTG